MDLSAVPLVIFMCSAKLNLESRGSPKSLGVCDCLARIVMVYLCFLTSGMIVLFIVKRRFVSNSAGSGVKSVAVLWSRKRDQPATRTGNPMLFYTICYTAHRYIALHTHPYVNVAFFALDSKIHAQHFLGLTFRRPLGIF